MRPEQWTKNIIIFAGLFFGRRLSDVPTLVSAIEVFFIFCIASTASYILNDIVDRNEDSRHPDKSRRPIARGTLTIKTALSLSALFMVASLIWAYSISPRLLAVLTAFLVLHLAYDLLLKHIPIIDVFAIALSFIIRLLAGVSFADIGFGISSWILLCTFLLALFLALNKRRAEMVLLLDKSKDHRRSLEGYTVDFLDQLITVAAACSILSYSIYALSAESVAKHGTDKLIYTIPFVVFGIFRYLSLVHLKKGGSNPEKILLKDVPFLANILCYVTVVYFLIYRKVF